MKLSIRTFDKLVSEGLQPIALYPGSKTPMAKGWNSNWKEAEERERIRKPLVNIGILLGNIVDVEGDSPGANAKINRIIGDYPHPVYKSFKSYHHLFLTPDPKLTILKSDDIEFRGHNHQSVIPPSIVNQIHYEWINVVFPIPKMNPPLLEFYQEFKKRITKKKQTKPGHIQPYCSQCQKREYIHKDRHRLELMAFKELNLNWTCHKCRDIDLRPRIKEIRKIIKHTNVVDWRDWLFFNLKKKATL